MSKREKRYFAVACGRETGIFESWYGEDGAESRVKGVKGARFKGFPTLLEAREWLRGFDNDSENSMAVERLNPMPSSRSGEPVRGRTLSGVSDGIERVTIYSDGACTNNPGPGGYGVVLIHKNRRKEMSSGFRMTTNNRMELLACIAGLSELKYRCPVRLYTDSKYVVNGIMKGWAKRWRSNGWMRNSLESAENVDLWEKLLKLCDKHDVEFVWIKGHNANPENERCDLMAKQAITQSNLMMDVAYEKGKRRL